MAQNCAYTGAMRIYYPFLGSELAQGNFPSRNAYCVRPDAGLHGEDLEVTEDDARTLAALDSLALLRDEESGSSSRCIIAADIEGLSWEEYDGDVAQTSPCTPDSDSIAAYFIDPPDAAPAVRKVLRAQTQEEADEAVAQLWEESLEWYAPEERELLLRVLESMNEKA